MNINSMLEQLQRFAVLEDAEDERIERLTVKAQGVDAIRYDKEKTQSQPALDRSQAAANELIMAKDKIAAKRRKRLKTRIRAHKIFWNNLPHEHAFIMDLIYIHGKSIKDVSSITGLSISWIYDINKRCVDNLNSKKLAESKTANYDKLEEKG